MYIIVDREFAASLDGEFATLDVAKQHLRQAVSDDVVNCLPRSSYEIIDTVSNVCVFEFEQSNIDHWNVDDVKKAISRLKPYMGNPFFNGLVSLYSNFVAKNKGKGSAS